jgi:hypothetical protein
MHKGEVLGVLQAILSFVFAAYCLGPYTWICMIDRFSSIVAGFRHHPRYGFDSLMQVHRHGFI